MPYAEPVEIAAVTSRKAKANSANLWGLKGPSADQRYLHCLHTPRYITATLPERRQQKRMRYGGERERLSTADSQDVPDHFRERLSGAPATKTAVQPIDW